MRTKNKKHNNKRLAKEELEKTYRNLTSWTISCMLKDENFQIFEAVEIILDRLREDIRILDEASNK